MKEEFSETDSGRLIQFRSDVAKPIITDSTEFVRNLFLSWKKLHKRRKEENLSHAVIGALFYESLFELFHPEHRNEFLEMIRKEETRKVYKKSAKHTNK